MTDPHRFPHDIVAAESRPGQMSRRRLLAAGLGAAAGLFAVERVVAALPNGGIVTAAGPLQSSELAPAERMPPPVPDGHIMFPVDAQESCWVSDNFGDCRGSGCSRSHEGLDISGSRGADIFAVVTGRLTKQYVDSGKTYGAGNGWTLQDEENNVTYKYFHMATHAEGLAVGDIVTQGDVIGTVGNTGTSGDSNFHLHFEYRPNGVAQDPLPLLVRPDNCTFYVG
ncbi:M23 family metallopeptidase [Ilumatobacter sp.]|uniref:M23 family metallopeptidase n=1 Tax=Ilumatobacter sp. TaxID=1967498 RepID=UPI003751065D